MSQAKESKGESAMIENFDPDVVAKYERDT